ncbi:hypothetical protein DACRYDRAFT_89660 [Dacryopinax primogenitus]|uniref:CDP-diacylglycerol--glycerol-3-phosphate 3-phosphatidyltransferase n=1 Tax=Dacryopinax primogenitus (strain DJM 731) TaxID=1858805 RepID=M5G4G0_DACPD|nr:uncharacterized protein DACRYDRAFT_89660 [Dacryopinax primogenitus]EJU00697.1 hypothetical protein DACRYDRAFT_89660 [Dacryopinax primogenitus]
MRLAFYSGRPTTIFKPVKPCTCLLRRKVSHLAEVFAKAHPTFSLSSKDVTILSEPRQFYKALLDMVKRARRRIFLSSLYIGTEETELIETLHRSLSLNSEVRLSLLLDLRRSTRPGPSTAHLLLPLLRAFPDRCEVRMFKSPKLRGLMERLVPRRFDEGWGTWHAKMYGVDDEVMFSGANLNTSYFTDRQDRYLHFSSQPDLAAYCLRFLHTFAQYSFRLLPTSSVSSSAYSPSEYALEWTNAACMFPHIVQHAERDILALQSSHPPPPSVNTQADTHLRPVLQAGIFNIREEERLLPLLIRGAASQGRKLDLTSGYFALHEPYQRAILKARIPTRILAAGPKANGFYASPGVSSRLPEAYTIAEHRFLSRARKAGLAGDHQTGEGEVLRLDEWEKEGWTYHAKGLWFSPVAGEQLPYATLFGSTNLNSRSAQLDTELSFLLSTRSRELQQALGREVQGLWEAGRRVDERDLDAAGRVRWGTRVLARVVGGML